VLVGGNDLADLTEAIITIRYYGGWADKTFGQPINTTPQKFAYTIRQPVGGGNVKAPIRKTQRRELICIGGKLQGSLWMDLRSSPVECQD
jgi:hypothetical protein